MSFKHTPFLLITALTLGACGASSNGEETPTAGTTPTPAGALTAVIATVSEDYSVGALATVNTDTMALQDTLTDISGDPAVVYSGGYLCQINRYSYDNVRVYEPGAWSAPLTEFALDDFANPHDIEVCEGLAFITEYGTSKVAIYDPTDGSLQGSISLAEFDDGDGTPEASDIVKGDNGKLYIGLENLDRNDGWASVGGKILEVDCATKAITQSWDVSSPSLFQNPLDPSNIIVAESGAGLRVLDTSTGTLSEVKLAQADTGVSILGVAAYGEKSVVITADPSYTYGIGCVDLGTWTFQEAESTGNYLIDISGNANGQAWISARSHWSDPEGPKGVIVYDTDTCTSLTPGGPFETLLAPFSIAFYE